MSQITRCPFCATTFKVVADQLRISDGWVRCGQCKEVFDASENLLLGGHEPLPSESQPPPDATDQSEAPPIAAESGPPVPSVPAFLVEAPVGANAESDAGADMDGRVDGFAHTGGNQGFTPLSSLLKRAVLTEPEPEPEPEGSLGSLQQEIPGYELPGAQHGDSIWPPDASNDVQAEPETVVQDAVQAPSPELTAALSGAEASDEPVAPSAQQELESLQAEPIPAEEVAPISAAAMAGSTQAAVAALPAEPEFVKAARRSAFWQRPLVRGGLVLAGLMLVLTLGMQMALQERDAIAARSPAAQALMEQLCQPLQCTLQPPRRIDALVIDSSSFLKARHGASAYQLQMGIKNNSTLTVAMPALELTLTDAHDETLLRRVLLRNELGAPAQLAPGAVWSGTVPMQVMQEASRVAGYRLLAFYP